MPKHPVGIDFGTSTSEICVFRPGSSFVVPDPASVSHSPVVPSVVALDDDGELVVGEEALLYLESPGRAVREVKRLMGSGAMVRLGENEYRPEEIAAVILKKLRGQAENLLGEEVRDVVLSVPANFPDAARRATFDAGQLAGLNIVRLINEPTAAALAFGIEHVDADEQVVVFDFGGGTLDITVLEMVFGVLDVKSSFGDPQLGGRDFDEALENLLLDKFREQNPDVELPEDARLRLRNVAQGVKVSLSSSDAHRLVIPGFLRRPSEATASTNDNADDVDTVLGDIDLDFTITRDAFEAACQPLLDRARACIEKALAAKQVRPEAIDRVVLVGGTTYIPCVRRLVEELFGQTPGANVSPDLAVVIGTSIQAALISGQLDPERGLILTDVAPFGMGIQVVSEVGGILTPVYEPLIVPNTTVPFSTRREYSLLTHEQEAVIVHLFQDHDGTSNLGSFVAAFDAKTGRTLWMTDRTATVGWGTPIVVRVDDHDELIVSSQRSVQAYDPDTGAELWTVQGMTREVIPTPVVGHDLVFASSGRAGPTLAIRPGGSGDVTDTHVTWRSPKGSPFVPSGIIHGDLLYLINDMQSILTVFDAASGELAYQSRLGEPVREGFSVSPVAVGDKLFFTNDNGQTFVVRAGPTFELLHVNELGTTVIASPALVDGTWYWRTDRELLAIGGS